jgi:HD-like signal output (HDOD) protein
MKRILFVDDEPNVLQGLQRMLRPLRNEWDTAYAGNGQEALSLLAQSPFDVVVSDMRMPGIDGAQLLNEVMKRYPHMVRIVLSGHSDQQSILRSVGAAHQYLSKPCDADTLKNTVARACGLRELLADKTLTELVAQMNSLPSLPSLYVEVMQELQSPDGSLQKVGQIISKDVGMSAKILQLVNSAFFGLRRHVSSPSEAAVFLGVDTVRALVLSVNIFSQFDRTGVRGFSIEALWTHSSITGALAKQIAKAEGAESKTVDYAFMAGLLHDAGRLVLAANLPAQYSETLFWMRAQKVPLSDAERERFGTTHAEVGAYLLGLWGLPDPIVEAIAYHHRPDQCLERTFSPLTAVHVANALEREGRAQDADEIASQVNVDYLADVGLTNRLEAWRDICRTALQEGEKK